MNWCAYLLIGWLCVVFVSKVPRYIRNERCPSSAIAGAFIQLVAMIALVFNI